jgi:hypothetical protein
MNRTPIALITLAGSLVLAPTAMAQRGAPPSRAPIPTMPSVSASPNPGITQRDEARVNREGPENASPTGVANANQNAGLSSATAADLNGLSTGLTVKDSSGATIGTVSRIEKSKDGKISNVLVAAAGSKRTLRLAPNTLSVSGEVVTTTAPPK